MADELFDIYDDAGAHLGVKPRGDVHRDGDWHRSLHLWIVSSDGALVMQQRADDKDSCPGMFDASVGGHLTAGETVEDALREADEELGVTVQLHDTVEFGVRTLVAEPHPGFRNRERCSVMVLIDDRPLNSYRFDTGEISALVRVPVEDLAAMLADSSVTRQVEAYDGLRTCTREMRAGAVVAHDYLPELISFINDLERRPGSLRLPYADAAMILVACALMLLWPYL